MQLVPSCPDTPSQLPDGTLSCASGWILVELPSPDPIHTLTGDELMGIGGQIILVLATAYVFRVAKQTLFSSGYGRSS